MAARGRRVGMVFIVLALILVVILGAVAYFFKDSLFPSPVVAPVVTAEAPVVKTVDIVVLTQNVSFGGAIPDTALGFAPIPADRYVEGLYFKTKDQVKGRRARYQLQSGTILTTGMISESSVGSMHHRRSRQERLRFRYPFRSSPQSHLPSNRTIT